MTIEYFAIPMPPAEFLLAIIAACLLFYGVLTVLEVMLTDE